MNHRRHSLHTLFAMLAIFAGLTFPAQAADKGQLVKAAFLYNFTKFVSWPDDMDITVRNDITICIMGANSLGDATSVFDKASTATLRIYARIINAVPSEPGSCHMVYIDSSQAARLPSLIAQSQAIHALTVSDIDQFIDKGGMIGFVSADNKIRLDINRPAATAANLKIDAQLLEIARKVVR